MQLQYSEKQYSCSTINILVQIVMFCVDNVIIQYRENILLNNFVTGENNSVSKINTAVHHIILQILQMHLGKQMLLKDL